QASGSGIYIGKSIGAIVVKRHPATSVRQCNVLAPNVKIIDRIVLCQRIKNIGLRFKGNDSGLWIIDLGQNRKYAGVGTDIKNDIRLRTQMIPDSSGFAFPTVVLQSQPEKMCFKYKGVIVQSKAGTFGSFQFKSPFKFQFSGVPFNRTINKTKGFYNINPDGAE